MPMGEPESHAPSGADGRPLHIIETIRIVGSAEEP
jgi:hypothetical protein